MNVGLLSRVGYGFYTKPSLRQNFTAISSAAAGALLLIGTEGYAAQKYRQTPIGRQEERRAREEGTLIYKQLREHVFRPGVLGGLVGLGQRKTICRFLEMFIPPFISQHSNPWSSGVLQLCKLAQT